MVITDVHGNVQRSRQNMCGLYTQKQHSRQTTFRGVKTEVQPYSVECTTDITRTNKVCDVLSEINSRLMLRDVVRDNIYIIQVQNSGTCDKTPNNINTDDV